MQEAQLTCLKCPQADQAASGTMPGCRQCFSLLILSHLFQHSSSGKSHGRRKVSPSFLSSSLEWSSWWVLELAEQKEAAFAHSSCIFYSYNRSCSLGEKTAHSTGVSDCQIQLADHSTPQSQCGGPLTWTSILTQQFLWQRTELPFVICFPVHIMRKTVVMTETIPHH